MGKYKGTAWERDRKSKLKIVLIVLSIFAAVKMLFFAFGLDEEYQLVMAWRNVKGDELFYSMWEPHQTSAFLCALLMRPYLALVGTTGVVIWLRLCGTLIHLGVSWYLYRVLRRMISKDNAFLLGLIYFNTIPKQIMLPEFGIMQVWFLTLLSLFLIRYFDYDVADDTERTEHGSAVIDNKFGGSAGGGNRKYLILAAFALVLEVLSYPSCLLLYPLVIWIIWRRSGSGNRLADAGIFTGICALCGIVYLALLLRNNTPEGLLTTVSHIVNGDITHSLTFADKLLALGRELPALLGLCLGIFVLAGAGAKMTVIRRKGRSGKAEAVAAGKKQRGRRGKTGEAAEKSAEEEKEKERVFVVWLVWAGGLACLVELWYWVVFNVGYEGMQIHLAVFAAAGLFCHAAVSGKRGLGGKETGRSRQRGLLLDSILLAGGALAAVLYLTDLGLMDSIPHGMTAAFFGMALAAMCLGDADGAGGEGSDGTAGEGAEKPAGNIVSLFRIALLLWAFTAVFGKGYTLRSGTGYHNVLQSGGILKYGPAAGTISDYMCSYIYNCDYEDWQGRIQDGDRVLIMVDQVMNLGTIQYLFKDVEICHYSIVNPTAYDDRLLDYWEIFPGKQPNVIIVDDWYGQLMTDPDGWLMRYAEGEFGYTSMEEGRYIRIYRKEIITE